MKTIFLLSALYSFSSCFQKEEVKQSLKTELSAPIKTELKADTDSIGIDLKLSLNRFERMRNLSY